MLAAEVARADAERQRARLTAIFESITDSFIVVDDELRIVDANLAAQKLARQDLIGMLGRRYDAFPHLAGESLAKVVARASANRGPETSDGYVASLDRWFETNVFPLDHGMSLYTRDVTMK